MPEQRGPLILATRAQTAGVRQEPGRYLTGTAVLKGPQTQLYTVEPHAGGLQVVKSVSVALLQGDIRIVWWPVGISFLMFCVQT